MSAPRVKVVTADGETITVSLALLAEQAIRLFDQGFHFGTVVGGPRTMFPKEMRSDEAMRKHVKRLRAQYLAEFADACGYDLTPTQTAEMDEIP